MSTWIRCDRRPRLRKPVAIVGSPGLCSVGRIAIDHLINELRPKLFAELHSNRFPAVYHGPSWLGSPGSPGVRVIDGVAVLPRVEFYLHRAPELVITRGYQASASTGQYEVAIKVLDLYEELGVRRMFVLAAHPGGRGSVFCAATDPGMVEEMGGHGIGRREPGGFYGFSALVLGMGKLRNIRGLCLFGGVEPILERPESPDPHAAKVVLDRLNDLLKIDVDTSELERYGERFEELRREVREEVERREKLDRYTGYA
ncbi:MAG: PAC2 family protein [Methanocellales archaeon]|nr:PAC2 family protein [Methanocellales archaeon]